MQKLVGINEAVGATKSQTAKIPSSLKTNPVDLNYQSLNSTIIKIQKDSWDYKLIQAYAGVDDRIEIANCFKIERGVDKKYNPKGLGNKKLLWYSAPCFEFVNIIKQGLPLKA